MVIRYLINYYGDNYFITILGFSIYKSYYLSEQKTKNVNVYTNCIYEFNKRIDEIKNHSVNNNFAEIYSVSAEKIISDAFSYSENV